MCSPSMAGCTCRGCQGGERGRNRTLNLLIKSHINQRLQLTEEDRQIICIQLDSVDLLAAEHSDLHLFSFPPPQSFPQSRHVPRRIQSDPCTFNFADRWCSRNRMRGPAIRLQRHPCVNRLCAVSTPSGEDVLWRVRCHCTSSARLLTEGLRVRILSEEPKILTTSSSRFWLTQNGQYCAKQFSLLRSDMLHWPAYTVFLRAR
jgi:hypothetical protein